MVRSVIEGRLSKAAAARKFNTTPKTVAKRGGAFSGRRPCKLGKRSGSGHHRLRLASGISRAAQKEQFFADTGS
jgi:hypothetical protein